ncbi:Crp/Fnr family transcriptional regulator [Nonomuraea sp. NPDC049480]|uniref:Crp/Fnr family transcriptional regulator n=1 Tax=Nonomuraea sp. NPDC049480 TaxID=3364353 RepID=UPI0037B5DD9B
MDKLSEQDRAFVERAGHHRLHARGSAIVSQGQASGPALIVEEGWLKSAHVSAHGAQALLGIIGPGAVVGALQILTDTPHTGEVTALTDSQVLHITKPRFLQLLAERPAVEHAVHRSLFSRARDAEGHLASICSLPPEQRLCRLILCLVQGYGERTGSGLEICIPLSQLDFAAWAGVSIETVQRILRTWRRRGIISTGRQRITVLDATSLSRITCVNGRASR